MVLWVWGTACRPEAVPVEDQAELLEAPALHDATFALTSLGPRQVATPEETLARTWIADRFTQLGLEPDLAPFTFDAWRPGVAEIRIGQEIVGVEALSPSPATDAMFEIAIPADDFAGAMVLSSDADFDSRTEALFMALSGGAGALVRITEAVDHDDSPLVEVGHLLDGVTLPAVAVDRATGAWLLDHLGEQARLHIAPDIALDHVSYNLVARIPGDGVGTVYVLAHYDSWHPSESAFDNALGVGGLVQLAARLAAGAPPEREVVFIATGAEEQGLRGAAAWVAEHLDEIGPEDLVMVLDVMWSGEGDYIAMATTDALRDEAMDAAAREGLEARDGGVPDPSSDHFPFVTAGAEAIWLGRWPDRHYHTVADTLDQLDLDDGARALRTHWRLLAAHAGVEE